MDARARETGVLPHAEPRSRDARSESNEFIDEPGSLDRNEALSKANRSGIHSPLKKNRPRNGIRKPPNDESSVNKSSRPSLVSLVQSRFARRRFDSGRHRHPPLPSSPIQPHPPSLFRRLATFQTAGASPSTSIAVAVSSGFTPVAGVVAFAAARSNKDFMGDVAGGDRATLAAAPCAAPAAATFAGAPCATPLPP